MAWSSQQSARLRLETDILSRYFPTFSLRDSIIPGHAVVEGTMRSNAGHEYVIRLHVPADLPNSVPVVEIISPILKDRFGHSLVDLGTSYSMHLLKPRKRCGTHLPLQCLALESQCHLYQSPLEDPGLDRSIRRPPRQRFSH